MTVPFSVPKIANVTVPFSGPPVFWPCPVFWPSGFGKDTPGKSEGAAKVAEYVARQMRRGDVRAGEVHLTPQWRVDYVKLVSDYVADARSAR